MINIETIITIAVAIGILLSAVALLLQINQHIYYHAVDVLYAISHGKEKELDAEDYVNYLLWG